MHNNVYNIYITQFIAMGESMVKYIEKVVETISN
jgi:hypothetical protein